MGVYLGGTKYRPVGRDQIHLAGDEYLAEDTPTPTPTSDIGILVSSGPASTQLYFCADPSAANPVFTAAGVIPRGDYQGMAKYRGRMYIATAGGAVFSFIPTVTNGVITGHTGWQRHSINPGGRVHAFGSDGTLLVAAVVIGNRMAAVVIGRNGVIAVEAAGDTHTLPDTIGRGGFQSFVGLEYFNGNWYTADWSRRVIGRFATPATASSAVSRGAPGIRDPQAMFVFNNNLYIGDRGIRQILRVDDSGAQATVTKVSDLPITVNNMQTAATW